MSTCMHIWFTACIHVREAIEDLKGFRSNSILTTNQTSVKRELLLKPGSDLESETTEFNCEVKDEDSEQETRSLGAGPDR